MTTAMDVRLIETRHVLDSPCKARIVLLSKHVVDQCGVSECVHNPWVEVTSKTVPFREVQHEVGRSERSGLHTPASCAVSDVERVLRCGWLDVVTISAKACVRVKDGGLKDLSGVVILRLRILRPIPIPEQG